MRTGTDIAIVGGGPVGLSAALALEQDGRHVTILESGRLQQPVATGLDTRSIALSCSSVQIFRAIGIWQDIKKHASPIKTIHVSTQGFWGVTRLRASDYDLESMGYVIENRKLVAVLLDHIQRCKSISLETGAEFESLDIGGQVSLRYRRDEESHQLEAGLVIISDGAQSKARSSLGIEHRQIDYRQSALITNVEVSKPAAGTAFERFTADGPLAMLPLGQNYYACVWTHDPGSSDRLMQLEEREFAEALHQSFGYRLGYIEASGPRYCFPLHRTEALGLVKDKCLLIGNAANTLHPVAGQGLNLALRDVASLSHLLEHQMPGALDEASIPQLLEEYQSIRGVEQQRVVCLGDGLVSLFSNDLPVLKQFRGGALALLDIVPPLKTQVGMSGMGFGFEGNPGLRGQMR